MVYPIVLNYVLMLSLARGSVEPTSVPRGELGRSRSPEFKQSGYLQMSWGGKTGAKPGHSPVDRLEGKTPTLA